MNPFFRSAMFAITLGISGSVLAQDFRVVAIDESPGRTMNVNLFSSADPEAVKKYMPDGGAPASVTSFVLFAGEDTVLIDTCTGNEMWVKKLTDLGVKPENVKLILLTHFHGDHIGGLFQGNARRFPNAKVFASTPEYDYYALRERQPQGGTGASFGKIKAAYGEDFVKFNFGDEVFANSQITVKALDAVGHTPGHTAFLIEPKQEGKEKLLMIIGDLLHAAALQFPVPEACASFDMDKEKAVAARKRILDFAAQEKIPVAGMHLPPPSLGTVKKEDKGGYIFELKTP
jgi:glyoxylase-like metal-dependent hydrolase (beta-lactamase superfamily II)